MQRAPCCTRPGRIQQQGLQLGGCTQRCGWEWAVQGQLPMPAKPNCQQGLQVGKVSTFPIHWHFEQGWTGHT